MIGGGGARTAPSDDDARGRIANKNFVPDCDLKNKATSGECGAWATQNFGEFLTSTVDPRLTGHDGMWFRRPYDWGFGVSIQHETPAALPRRFRLQPSLVGQDDGRRQPPDRTNADFDPITASRRRPIRVCRMAAATSIGDLWDIETRRSSARLELRRCRPATSEESPVLLRCLRCQRAREVHGVTMRVATSTGRQVTDNCELISTTRASGTVTWRCRSRWRPARWLRTRFPRSECRRAACSAAARDRRFRRTTSVVRRGGADAGPSARREAPPT